jgi:regulator of RNase E activity RraA
LAAGINRLRAVGILINRPFHSLAKSKLGFPVSIQGISAVTMFKSNQTQGKLAPDIACRLGEQIAIIRSGDIAIMDSDDVFILSVDIAQQLLSDCQKKHKEDEMKFQRFFEAYRNNKLDKLFNN